MNKNDEFNNLGITNADGDEKFNEDILPTPDNDLNQPDIEVSNEGHEDFKAEEYLEEAGEIETASEENYSSQETNQDQTTTSSSSSAASTASTATAGASAGIAATVATSVVVVASVTIGIVSLPLIPSFDVELARATSSSLAFVLTTNVEETEHISVILEGKDDYIQEAPYSSYIKFEELNPQETYYLSIYNNDDSLFNATYFTTNEEAYDSVFIEVYEQSEEGFYFTFYDGLVEDETARFHNVKVISNKGDVLLADDTNDMEKEYFVNKNVDASILVYINGIVEGGASVTKYSPEDIEYDYDNIQWSWGETGETCSVYIPAVNQDDPPFESQASVEVTYRREPQCEEDGYITSEATIVAPNGETYSDMYQGVLPATGHNYGEPTYEWSIDYLECYAERICINNSEHIESETATAEYKVVTEPTTELEGSAIYTATFENDAFETQTMEVTLPVIEDPTSELLSDFTNCVSTNSMVGTGSVTSNIGNTFEMNIYNTNTNGNSGVLELINVFNEEQSFISNKTPTDKPIKGLAIHTDADENNVFEVGVALSISEISSSATAQELSTFKEVISSSDYVWYTEEQEINYFSVCLGANSSSGSITSIIILYEDMSYTIDEENNTLNYGVYPTTLVTDSDTNINLSNLNENYIDRASSYYWYNGKQYESVTISSENNIELYDGTILESGNSYWFECTPIEWIILDIDENGYYTLITKEVLDTVQYHTSDAMDSISTDAGVTTIYANNYYNSYIRSFLNDAFINRAFSNSNKGLITPVEFDVTESATYGIKCDNINTTMTDFIHLPTYNELYMLYSSGIGGSNGRSAKLTTYSIAKGAEMTSTIDVEGTQKAYGGYWLSTPGTGYQYNGAYISYVGELYDKDVMDTTVGIRPIIRLKLN